jgi:hypothetical protein
LLGATRTPARDRAEAIHMRHTLDLFDGRFDTNFIKRLIA